MPGTPIAIRVEGSGPVAAAFTLFALREGFGPDAIEPARDGAPVAEALANRLIALSLGAWQLLGRVAPRPPAAPILAVEVRVTGHAGRTRMTAAEHGVPALGYTVRYGALLDALSDAVLAGEGTAKRADAVAGEARRVTVHAGGDTGADARTREFDQCALLADVRCEADAAGTAFECFTTEGPLAMLPLPEARRMSLVWCASEAACARRAALPARELAAELRDAFGGALGELAIDAPVAVAPLVRRARRVLARGDEVWIGNAAQALHPVAGQGLNLGLRDAFELARTLGDANERSGDVAAALAAYASGRTLDREAAIAVTDALAAVFTAAPLRPLQSVALAALELMPPARGALARRFMFGLR